MLAHPQGLQQYLPDSDGSMMCSRSKQNTVSPFELCHMVVESGPLCRRSLVCLARRRRFSLAFPCSPSATSIPHIPGLSLAELHRNHNRALAAKLHKGHVTASRSSARRVQDSPLSFLTKDCLSLQAHAVRRLPYPGHSTCSIVHSQIRKQQSPSCNSSRSCL